MNTNKPLTAAQLLMLRLAEVSMARAQEQQRASDSRKAKTPHEEPKPLRYLYVASRVVPNPKYEGVGDQKFVMTKGRPLVNRTSIKSIERQQRRRAVDRVSARQQRRMRRDLRQLMRPAVRQ